MANQIASATQGQQMLNIECTAPFCDPPTLTINFQRTDSGATAPVAITLKLPIVCTKFLKPLQLDTNQFFGAWKKIEGEPKESQNVFKLSQAPGMHIDKLLSDLHFAVLKGIDPNAANYVAAGTMEAKGVPASEAMAAMVRMEINAQMLMCRLTVRTYQPDWTTAITHLLKTNMAAKGQ